MDLGRLLSAKTVRSRFHTLRPGPRFLAPDARMPRCPVRPGKWCLA